MNLYEYLEKNIDKAKIQEFNDDEYEIALVRYVLMQTARIFYRNRLFFLDEEQIKIRHLIYNEQIDIRNINSYDIVCSSYCRILQEVLKNKYTIQTELLEADRDEFKHIVMRLITSKGNRYLIDPLMDLTNMKTRMKTHNFATIEKDSNNPYIRIQIDGLKYIDDGTIRRIDEKIGYLENNKYKDDIQDKEILNALEKIQNRNRGLLIECGDIVIAFFMNSMRYLKIDKVKWKRLEKNNKIFVKRKILINEYKYLNELELETNILDHKEFLKIFKTIEEKAIKNSDNIGEFIDVSKKRDSIAINYDKLLEFKIENNFLVVFNKTDSIKTIIEFTDEGRKVQYHTSKFLNG
ncbi:MAG: hypothetical protein HFJ35_07750 [Clostridia bacterium]|nr:hypothetical protein [Clostridia bacterium]